MGITDTASRHACAPAFADDASARLPARLADLKDALPRESFPIPIVASAFVHNPQITLMRGGVPTVINGPVAPVAPRITKATALGWEKYYVDRTFQRIAKSTADNEASAVVRDFFARRRQNKEAEAAARYVRFCERQHKAGKPVLTRPEFEQARFDRSYARACQKAAAKGFTPPSRESHGKPPPNWEMLIKGTELVEKMRSARKNLHSKKRLERYYFPGGDCADRRTAPFVEEFFDAQGNRTKAYRTDVNIVFELFSSALPKDVVYGENKRTVYNAVLDGTSRVEVRDAAYIETSRVRRCLFVVDLDGWWPSVKAMWKALRKFLLPQFMPNAIVYRAPEDGRGGIENPHLIFLLPPGSRVIPGKNKDKQQQLHKMIQKGIVNHLIDAGADPDHHNSDKMKDPISPKWSCIVQDESFATMDEWRAFLPTVTPDLRAMRRRAKILKAERTGNIEAELSNAMWADGIAARRMAIRSAQRRKDPAFLEGRRTHDKFVAWLYHPQTGVVVERMLKLHGDSRALRSVLSAQRELVVELGRIPDATSGFSDRGRDAAVNVLAERGFRPENAEERESVRIARQSGAGTRSRANERAINCGLIAEEIQRKLSTGLSIDEVIADKAAIVKTLIASGNVARATAYRRFDEVAETVSQAARYQAKRISEQAIDPVPVQPVELATVVPPSPLPGSPAKTIRRSPVDDFDSEFRRRQRASIRLESWLRALKTWRAALRERAADDENDDPAGDTWINVDLSFWSCRRH